jgi:nucleoid DNA-binding protein
MTLNKNKMIREIGRRTRLKNREVQLMLETLIDVWTESLVSGERIELENLFVLETRMVDRGENGGTLSSSGDTYPAPRTIRRLTLRTSRRLKALINDRDGLK